MLNTISLKSHGNKLIVGNVFSTHPQSDVLNIRLLIIQNFMQLTLKLQEKK